MADKQETPQKSKSKSRPPAPERKNSDESQDQGYESRSRSASRRRRRQNQRQKGKASGQAQSGKAKADSMAAVEEQEEPEEEADEEVQNGYAPKSEWLKNPQPQDTTETQPFDYIKPPSQSMMGPVTYAKMQRGEIPWQGPPPRQPLNTTQGEMGGGDDAKDPMDQDGLKLRIELNLDIEIELKAHIHGDLTLALLA